MSSPKHHALLSASSANRWLSAPPLPRLEQYFPHSTSNAAAEGTAAHALGSIRFIDCLVISSNAHLLTTNLMRWRV